MKARAPLLVAGCVIVALTGCADDSSDATKTTEPTRPSLTTETSESPPESTEAAVQVPSAQQLSAMLLSEADLDGEWSVNPWGLQPTDTSSIRFGESKFAQLVCEGAPEDFQAAEQTLHWQAFVHLDEETGWLAIEEMLWADELDTAESLYATLEEGLNACVSAVNAADPGGDGAWESLTMPEVGDQRTGVLIDYGPSILYATLVRDGPVVAYTGISARFRAQLEFGADQVEQVIRTVAGKITETDQGAFTFAADDLCEWVTADEVAGFFASTSEWDGTAELVNTEDSGPDECWWRLTGDELVEISAGNAEPGFLLPYDEIVEYEGGTVPAPGGTVSGHPALSEGVVVQSAGWGAYAFWVPPRDEYLSLFEIRYSSDGSHVTGVDSATDETVRAEDQHRFFAFADLVLQELGWVP